MKNLTKKHDQICLTKKASFATDIRKIYGLERFQHLTIKFLKEYVAASEGVRIPENTLYYTDGLALMSKFGEKQDFPIFQNYMKKLRKLIKKEIGSKINVKI